VARPYYAAAKFAARCWPKVTIWYRVRSNAVAYFPPSRPRVQRQRRGERRSYGPETQLRHWVGYRNCSSGPLVPLFMGNHGITLRYLQLRLACGVRWSVSAPVVGETTRLAGNLILLCTDLYPRPAEIIRLYGWRFKLKSASSRPSHTWGLTLITSGCKT